MPPTLLQELRRLARLLRLARARKSVLLASTALNLAAILLNLCGFALLFPLVDSIVRGNASQLRALPVLGPLLAPFASEQTLFFALAGAIYASMLAKNLLSYLAECLATSESRHVASNLRVYALERVLRFGKKYYDEGKAAELHASIMSSSRWIEASLNSLQVFLTHTGSLLIFVGLMASVSWKLTGALCLILPAAARLMGAITQRIRKASQETARSHSSFNARALETLRGIALVRAYGKEREELAKLHALSDHELRLEARVQRLNKLIVPVHDSCAITGMLLMAWILSGLLRAGEIQPGELFVFLFLASKTLPAFHNAYDLFLRLANFDGAVSHFERLISDEDKFILPSGSQRFEGLKERIEFRNLTFSYQPGMPVLRDFNLVIEKGKTTALVGPSGAGKSTIASLLLRLCDCPSNSLFIDGSDIRDLDPASLRSRMAFVSQSVFLFNDTLRNNLLYGINAPVSDAALQDAVSRAKLTDLIARLPDGLDTLVGDNGARFSGGERQRIALAQAYLRDPEILILDEPTSALDPETESLVTEALASLTQGRTLLVIAHRPLTVERAHSVVRLAESSLGRVA